MTDLRAEPHGNVTIGGAVLHFADSLQKEPAIGHRVDELFRRVRSGKATDGHDLSSMRAASAIAARDVWEKPHTADSERAAVVEGLRAEGRVVAAATSRPWGRAADLPIGPEAETGIAVDDLDVAVIAAVIAWTRAVRATTRANRMLAAVVMALAVPLAGIGALTPLTAALVATGALALVAANTVLMRLPSPSLSAERDVPHAK